MRSARRCSDPLAMGRSSLGRGGRQAQRQRGVVGDGGERSQGDLAVDLDHVGPEVGRSQDRGVVGRAAAEAALRLAGWGPTGGAGATRRR